MSIIHGDRYRQSRGNQSFPGVTPLYDSVGTAAFQARYVQSAAVTRAGANYTGPVTGKVNMYVTYD